MLMDNYLNVYSIYDKVAARYGPLYEATNDAVAVRQYRNSMEKVNVAFKTDYILYRIGHFDCISGVFDEDKELINTGVEVDKEILK